MTDAKKGDYLSATILPIEHTHSIRANGQDMPEVRGWRWRAEA